jgi:hypothetical protein
LHSCSGNCFWLIIFIRLMYCVGGGYDNEIFKSLVVLEMFLGSFFVSD